MRKHTTIDLDRDLVAQAADALGTSTTTDTIHTALAEVVRARRRLDLMEADIDLTLADLDGIRGHRFAERPAPYGERRPARPARHRAP